VAKGSRASFGTRIGARSKVVAVEQICGGWANDENALASKL
jgi:hypothetical protein